MSKGCNAELEALGCDELSDPKLEALAKVIAPQMAGAFGTPTVDGLEAARYLLGIGPRPYPAK